MRLDVFSLIPVRQVGKTQPRFRVAREGKNLPSLGVERVPLANSFEEHTPAATETLRDFTGRWVAAETIRNRTACASDRQTLAQFADRSNNAPRRRYSPYQFGSVFVVSCPPAHRTAHEPIAVAILQLLHVRTRIRLVFQLLDSADVLLALLRKPSCAVSVRPARYAVGNHHAVRARGQRRSNDGAQIVRIF